MNKLDAIRARLEKQHMVVPDDVETLLDWLQIIHDLAEPLRYAVKYPQNGTTDQDFITAGDGYLYRNDEDEYLQFIDLKKLMNAIDNDYPELKIPAYKDES